MLCSRRGITCAALTDHNSVRGIESFARTARTQGIRVITGTELDCTLQGVDLHLLGYGIDAGDERYRELEENILEQKRATSRERMRILQEMGICFDEQRVWRLARQGIVVGEMIAQEALEDERNRNNPLLAPYRPGGARGDNPYVNFFWDFCSQGKAAFLPIQYPSFEEACGLIRETGGFAVIAHPVNTVGRREELIRYMAQYGAAGLEVFSSYHSAADVLLYRQIAGRCRLMMTAGSDFHGKTKPSVRLGDTNGFSEEDERRLRRALRPSEWKRED